MFTVGGGGTGCQMQGERCQMPDARCKMQVLGCRVQTTLKGRGGCEVNYGEVLERINDGAHCVAFPVW